MFNVTSLGAPFHEMDTPVLHRRSHRDDTRDDGTHNNSNGNLLKIFSDPIIASVIPSTPIQQSTADTTTSKVLSEITFQTPPTRRVVVEPAFLFDSPTVDSAAAADSVTDFVELPKTPKQFGSFFQASPLFHNIFKTSPLPNTTLSAIPTNVTTTTTDEPIGTKSVPPKPPIGLFRTFPKLDFESIASRKIFTSTSTTTVASAAFLTSPAAAPRPPAVSPMVSSRKRKLDLQAFSPVGPKRRLVAVTNENSRPSTPIKLAAIAAPVVTAAITPTAPEKKLFKCFSMDYCSEAHSKSAASRRQRHKNLFPEPPSVNRLSLKVNPLTGKAEIMQEAPTVTETTAGITTIHEEPEEDETVATARRLREIEEEEETEKEDNDEIDNEIHTVRFKTESLVDSDIFEKDEEALLNEIVNNTGLLLTPRRTNAMSVHSPIFMAEPTVVAEPLKPESKIEPPLARIKALIARRKAETAAAAAAATTVSEAASIATAVASPASFPLTSAAPAGQRPKAHPRINRAGSSRSCIDTTGLRPNTYMSTPTTTPKKRGPAKPPVIPSTPAHSSNKNNCIITTAATAPAGRSGLSIKMVSTPTLITKHYTPKRGKQTTPASVHPTPPASVSKSARTPGNHRTQNLVQLQPRSVGAKRRHAPAMDAMFPSLAESSSSGNRRTSGRRASKSAAPLVSPSASEQEADSDNADDDSEAAAPGLCDARSAFKVALLRDTSSSFLVDDESIYL
ncbi:hypothetical protein D0Z00_003408 [Geotrichum galactomycetum]|uniref:Uncharacterized protein n=1 Tax=Geotrichum galactomycetum TaxID=27317 RepID=A0ACB6V191_9ASCO|nr:hypothetical protein D0Z00_003408 [Geotrichum candidum]